MVTINMDITKALKNMEAQKEIAVAKTRKFESAFGAVSPYREDVEAFDVALSAMRKRVPIKPSKAEGFEGMCVICKYVLAERSRCCPNCGQRINWEAFNVL